MKNYKLKITVTKEILKSSIMCGLGEEVLTSCAVARAVVDIFPKARVYELFFRPFGIESETYINLPPEAGKYIRHFDYLSATPKQRLDLPEITFEVEIPDEVIDHIDISKIYEGHPTLQLFESIDN